MEGPARHGPYRSWRPRGGGCEPGGAGGFGTPLFVLCEETFRSRLRRYLAAFGEGNVFYAAKAFICRSTAALVAEEGAGMDVVSAGELATALAAGFPAARILLHGNNKSAQELAAGADAGVGAVVVDAWQDIERLEELGSARGRRLPVLVRVAPGVEADTHSYVNTGKEGSKFGFPLAEGMAMEAVGRVLSSPHLELLGLHAHIGSQILSLEPYSRLVEVMLSLAEETAAALGWSPPILDYGGGLGIPYTGEEDVPSIEELAAVLKGGTAAEAGRRGLPEPRVAVEPGRSVVGNAMVTVYTVGVVKRVAGGRRYAAVDGGMSENIRPMLYGARYTALVAERPEQAEEEFHVAGRHCESGDVLVDGVLLPRDLSPGEHLVTPATGAYGYSMASNYNRVPRPAVVSVAGGRARVVVRRETVEDLLRLDAPAGVGGGWKW